MKRNGIFSTKNAADIIILLFTLLILCIVCFFQFYLVFWMLSTSLKDDIDLYTNMYGFPDFSNLKFSNYKNVLYLVRVEQYVDGVGYVNIGLPRLLLNSVLIAFIMPLQGIFWNNICAYIFSKYQFKGRELMLKINFLVIVLPALGGLAAQLKINHMIGRYDNFIMMCLTGVHPFTGLNLLVMMSFYRSIPKEMMEAAKIDGAGHFVTFFFIHVPLMLPIIFFYYMMGVFGAWNDYMTSLVWLPSMPNLALGIYQFQYDSVKYAATLPEVRACFAMVSVPTVLFYLTNQKFIVKRMVMTGLKE